MPERPVSRACYVRTVDDRHTVTNTGEIYRQKSLDHFEGILHILEIRYLKMQIISKERLS